MVISLFVGATVVKDFLRSGFSCFLRTRHISHGPKCSALIGALQPHNLLFSARPISSIVTHLEASTQEQWIPSQSNRFEPLVGNVLAFVYMLFAKILKVSCDFAPQPQPREEHPTGVLLKRKSQLLSIVLFPLLV
jgi:hypothetical protein